MLKYGLPAKGIELMCFKPVFETLNGIYPDTDTDKKSCRAVFLPR